ncbi:MAG: DMT family transporter [Rhodobacteraceae bacterium]|nr:DMT family transporter [Paracoccaceae bacterium]
MQISDNLRGSVYMSLAMAAFTVNDTCMKVVTAEMPLYQALVLRGTLTMIALYVIALRRGGLQLRVDPADGRRIGYRTIGEVGGTVTFLTALKHMPLANLSAIMQVLPLAVTLVAALFLRERVGWRRLLAILIGFSGVLLIIRPGSSGFDIWSLLGLASVAFVVLRDLVTRRLSRAVPSVTVAFYAAASVTVLGLVGIPFTGWIAITLPVALLIAGASSFLIVGYLAVVMAMRVGEVGVVAPFRYTALVFAIGLGWLAFRQLPDTLTLIGAGIVIVTGIYTFYRERKIGQRLTIPQKVPLRLR